MMNVYAFRNSDQVVEESASGGAFSAIVESFFELSNSEKKVYGCCFDDNLDVKHIGVESKEEIKIFRTSKYVESDIKGVYQKVLEDLKANKYVLFSGAPCQVAGLKSYLRVKNVKDVKLYTIDIICHGTPSRKYWNDYKEWLERVNNDKLVGFSFRYSKAKWKLYPCMARYKSGKIKVNTQDTRMFTRLFFSHLTIRESCFKCKYSNMNRVGDITIGDFWGIDTIMPEFIKQRHIDSKSGVSLVIENTEKGNQLIEIIKNKSGGNIQICLSNEFIKYQHNLNSPTQKPKNYDCFISDYENYGFDFITRKYGEYTLLGRVIFDIKKILHEYGIIEKIKKITK